jgi:hypothetical protein
MGTVIARQKMPYRGLLGMLAVVTVAGCMAGPASGPAAPGHGQSASPSAQTAVACGGQCGPPYELMVQFLPGTPRAAAQKLLTSCTDHNPVVIRVGTLRDVDGGLTQAMIYTRVFGDTPRTAGCSHVCAVPTGCESWRGGLIEALPACPLLPYRR